MLHVNGNTNLYPFLLQPVIKEKVWGGRNLAALGKHLPPGKLIGESWEAWEGCVVENGAHAGQSLERIIDQDPKRVLGSTSLRGNDFPLLFKFIDAHQDLSVQVHPDDDEARALESLPRGKTEAWYILRAEPGARLILGFNRQVTPDQVSTSVRDNTLMGLLMNVPAERGDVLFVPAGTVHAIGTGIVLAEIQENSDITYRLYDWGREDKNRPLHIDQSLRVLDYDRMHDPKIARLSIHMPGLERKFLVACRYFALELLEVSERTGPLEMEHMQILAMIEGDVDIRYGREFAERVAANRGQTVVIPAGLQHFVLEPKGTRCSALRAYEPDLRLDVIQPLRGAGYDAAEIAGLGGTANQHNDLQVLAE